MERPPEHPRDVGVDRGDGLLEGKTRHGARGVTADTGEEPQRFHVVRNLPAVLTDHIPREPVQIRGSAVVPQPIPSLPDPCGPRPSEGLDRRKCRQESAVVRLDSRHLGLLQHDFGHEDAIRIAGTTPGKVPTMAPEPREELALEE